LRRQPCGGQTGAVRVPMALIVSLLANGCASASPPAVTASTRASPPLAVAPAPVSPTRGDSHRLARSSVKSVVSQGLGAFLQQVELDDRPALVGGKFRGFRIAVLHDSGFWNGVDLRPGDVVTGINGFPIERPEQAQTAFDSVAVASELRVTYERNGQPRELVYSIVDAP
jgi:type II secretory pathway component PulC